MRDYYEARRPLIDIPGIDWQVPGAEPIDGLDALVRILKRHYAPEESGEEILYNGVLLDQDPEAYRSADPASVVMFQANRQGEDYGTITVEYAQAATDWSTGKPRPAQRFYVYFDFGAESFDERDIFTPGDQPYITPPLTEERPKRAGEVVPIVIRGLSPNPA